MPKRGRGLDKTLIRLPRIKRRLEFSLRKISGEFDGAEYQFLAETIRKDLDTLLEYAKTPEDKLRYTQYIFKLGQFYLWKPWKVGTLSDAKSREYILGKAMQAEQDQYKYVDVVNNRARVAKNKRDVLDALGATKMFQPRKPSPLTVRIPKQTGSRELKEYKAARKRCTIAEIKVQKYLKLVQVKERSYRADNSKDNFEQLKKYAEMLSRQNHEQSCTRGNPTDPTELDSANRDLPVKKAAYERSKQPKAPRAKTFIKR